MFTAQRYHDISCGHRVFGHEGKCAHLHGHNYRIWFFCRADKQHRDLDNVGRVIDFSVIKEKLCMWVEEHWDHKFLIWIGDDTHTALRFLDKEGVVETDFNPTAENIAAYLVAVVGPGQLRNTGVELFKVTVEETAKCSATYEAL